MKPVIDSIGLTNGSPVMNVNIGGALSAIRISTLAFATLAAAGVKVEIK
jgi:hypothetical protein